MHLDDLLDQVYPVVDGGPVEECHVLLVRLPDVEARLHQLPAALEDSVPGKRAALFNEIKQYMSHMLQLLDH